MLEKQNNTKKSTQKGLPHGSLSGLSSMHSSDGPLPRKPRRDKGIVMATPRDLHLIAWIADQYACRQDHLQELLSREAGAPMKGEALALSTVKDQIERWRKAGWIEYQRYLANEPGWAWITKAGLHLVGLDTLYLAKAPAPVRYHHIWAVNDVRLFWWSNEAYEKEERIDAKWISERRLRAEMTISKKHPDHTPATIQIARGMIPDAVVVGRRWVNALEIELTPKKPEETQEKLKRLCRATYRVTATGKEYCYNEIHFYVPNKAMQQHLERARTHLDQNELKRVQVYLDEKLQRKV